VAVDAPEDASLRYEVVNMRDVPVREHHVTANFPLEIRAGSSVGHTAYNGVTRQIPGTQTLDSRNGNPIPPEETEPLWMKLSTTGPCPAGSVLLRDSRAWHGGTPNLGEFVRAIPCAIFGEITLSHNQFSFFVRSAARQCIWICLRDLAHGANVLLAALPPHIGGSLTGWSEPMPGTLPYDTWQLMTGHGKHICRMIVGAPGAKIERDWRPDWRVDEAIGGGGETNAAHQGQVVAQLPPPRL
jgi:hypothetical protein